MTPSGPSVQDLSTIHGPMTDRFGAPATGPPPDVALTDDEVRSFHEHGFLSGVRLLSHAQVELLRGELSGFLRPDHKGHELWHEYHSNESTDPDTVLFHALGAWRIAAGFHDLLWHPRFTVPASQLLGGPVRFWHDQLFCKPAHQGGVVAWHQDYSYWTRTRPMAHLSCWIGLDDASIENGCLRYVSGSHRWDLLPVTGLAGDMRAIREVLSDEQWEALQHPVAVEVRAGECSFHHPLTVHGSEANHSDAPRRATVINVMLDGVRSDTDEPLLAGTPATPKGAPLGGRFHPRLIDARDVTTGNRA